MRGHISLILGGARSGKSARAEHLAKHLERPVVYVATYFKDATDSEMLERITVHKTRRPCGWETVEGRFDLGQIFHEHPRKTVLLDCLTLWLSHQCAALDERSLLRVLEDALESARLKQVTLLIVSNELGMGLVPGTPLGRSFRDLCGRANQLVANTADHVEFQIAGLPLNLKGGPPA
jgi:adenosylcobinamide kinase/adenosylcobinamide-phosphate guanylyltransferase